eukprot:13074838-Ditylum_brightwellii.AAC.1
MKLSKSYPKALVYCKTKILGSSFFHLKYFHISARVMYLIKHLCHKSYIDDTVQTMINWAQHTTGISTPILTTHRPLPHLKGSWINQFGQDLYSINNTAFIHDAWTYPTT